MALVAGGRIAITLTQEQSKTMGIVCVYLVEIFVEQTLAPVATNEFLRERSLFLERVTII